MCYKAGTTMEKASVDLRVAAVAACTGSWTLQQRQQQQAHKQV